MRILKKRITFQTIAWFLAFLLAACQDWPFRSAGGGSGTEAENGEVVVGRVLLPDGHVAVGAEVFINRSDFLRDTSLMNAAPPPAVTVTDLNGFFKLDSLKPGAYQLEIHNGKGLANQTQFEVGKNFKRLELGSDTLQPVGILKGQVELISGAKSPTYIQIYGMNRLVRADATGAFLFPDLPPGYLRVQAVSPEFGWSYEGPSLALIHPKETTYLPSIKAIASITEDLATWPHSRRIEVKVDSFGITGTVHDFPVLVRLDSSTFNFSASDGKDIRFSDNQGKKLLHQIEQWEPARGFATIWTKLDSIVGKNPNPSFTMHWGKRNAPDFSNGKSVFATFAGVWHFSDALEGLGAGRIRDAAPYAGDGLAHMLTPNRLGRIGDGIGFSESSVVKLLANEAMKPAETLTLSTWVNLTGTGLWGAQLASMGNNYLLWISPDGNAKFSIYTDSTWDPNHDPAVNPWKVCSTLGIDLRNSGWHQVVSTYDGSTLSIFVDGVEKGNRVIGKPITYIFSKEFLIGMPSPTPTEVNSNWKFQGSLDELQVSGSLRSPEWIKLQYEAQKAGSTILEFQ